MTNISPHHRHSEIAKSEMATRIAGSDSPEQGSTRAIHKECLELLSTTNGGTKKSSQTSQVFPDEEIIYRGKLKDRNEVEAK